MIIFRGGGRLGNQIFQYMFMSNFAKKREVFLTFNFKEFKSFFRTTNHIINIEKGILKNFYISSIEPFMRKLVNKKVISYVIVNPALHDRYTIEGRDYTMRKGFLPIIFIEEGYFQSEKIFNKRKLRNFAIKKAFHREASSFLCNIPSKYKKIFVHIRRGDYVSIDHWILGLKDFTLPVKYYRQAFRRIEKKHKNVWYIFLSDDPDYVKDTFKNIKNKTVSNNNMYIDFAIMTLCDGGIIANSSFSWWGGYLCKCSKEDIIAPKYYLGFKNGFEYPKDILSCFPNQIDIT